MKKGVILHLVAKIVIILSGFFLQYFLARAMSVEEYGIVGLIVMLCNFYYMFLTDGAKQSLSQNISAQCYDSRTAIKKAVIVQILMGVGIGALNFFLAPFIAELYQDPSLAAYFKSISVMIPFTALFFVYTGVMNGRKLFAGETAMLMLFPLLKLIAIPISGAFPDARPMGVITGFTIAALASMITAAVIVYYKEKTAPAPVENPKTITYKQTLKGTLSYILFFSGVIIMLNMGVFILRAIEQSNAVAGYYTAVYNFALIPYYVVAAFFAVLLPFVSEAYQKGDTDKIRDMIKRDTGIIVRLVLPLAIMVCCSSEPLLRLFYGEEYLPAVLPMQIHVFGVFCLAVSVLFNIASAGMDDKKKVVILTVIVVAIDLALHIVLINAFEMVGASLATLISSAVMLAASTLMLKKRLGPLIDKKGLLRQALIIALFTVVCAVFYRFIEPSSLIMLIATYLVFGVAYLLCCAAAKTINVSDIKHMLHR